MLKKLVRERLLATADEIFGLFERTIASYEEQLCRAREETERHRRQMEAVCSTQIVLRVDDVPRREGRVSLELDHPQPPHIKEEEEKADVNKLPLTALHAERKDDGKSQSKSRLCHHDSPSGSHCGEPPPDSLLAPLSDGDDAEEPLRSDANCQGDDKQSEKKRTIGNDGSSQTRKQGLSCSVCGKVLSNLSILIIHLRTHTGEKPYHCSVCGKRYSQKGTMVSHMRTHTGEKPFSCKTCGKAFSQKQHLVSHLRTHTGEKPFHCSICGGRFGRRTSLNFHMRNQHREKK